MKNDETYYALFDLAITGEKKAREFFTGLAAKCSGHADLAAFWKKLAAEESGHIGMLEELKSSLTARELNLPADHAMLWKAREVLQFSVEESLHKIKTLDDAYERAHELESSEINTVYTFILEIFIPAEKRRAFLKEEIKIHQQKLTTFSDTFGNAGWRAGISI